MNFKKILATLLAVVMVLGTVSFSFAEDTAIFEIEEVEAEETVELFAANSDTVTVADFEEFKAALANTTDSDNDGIINIEVAGKIVIGKDFNLTSNAKILNFIGVTPDAEISVETPNSGDRGVIYVVSPIDTINFNNLKLSRINGANKYNEGFHNMFFTVWGYGGVGSTTDLVTYTNCVFPNGAGNNQYGKTTYDGCEFYGDYYALWIYGYENNTVVNVSDCYFEADRGVKIYSENTAAFVTTTIEKAEFDIESKPAIVSSIQGNVTLNEIDYDACEYGLLENEFHSPNAPAEDKNLAAVTIDGEIPKYVAMVNGAVFTDMEYAESKAGTSATVTAPVAKVGSNFYATIKEAVNATKDMDTAEVTILAGEYSIDAFTLGTNVREYPFADKLSIVADGNVTVKLDSETKSYQNGVAYQYFVGGSWYVCGKSIAFDGINFVFEDTNTADNQTMAEIQTYASESLSYTNCTFDNVSVSPWGDNATGKTAAATIEGCTFKNIAARSAIHQSKALRLTVADNDFVKVVNGIHISGDKLETLTVTGNDFAGIADGSAAIYFGNESWNGVWVGDYSDAVITVTDNTSDAALVRNGNKSLTASHIAALSDETANTFESAFTGNSVKFVAKIGNTNYVTFQAALDAATEGDTITILAGTYNGFDIPKESANNLTFVGETDAEGNNLVTIKTLEEGIESHNGGIYVGIETATFKNLDFTAGTFAAARLHGMASSLGETNSDTGMRSNLKNLTVENCNFAGSGAYQAIWTNTSNLTIKNSTIKNYNKGFYSVAMSADQRIVVDNTEITDVTYGIHLEETTSGSQVAVTESAIDAVVIALGGAVAMNITESEISNATVSAWSSTVNISESKLIDTSYGAYGNSTIVINNNYVNNANELVDNDAITFETYYKSEEDMENGIRSAVPAITDEIAVEFVKASEKEGEVVYNINLAVGDTEVINRLNSVDLSFVLNQIDGENEFEIIKSNSAIAVNSVEHSKTRYEFHFNGKPDGVADTANVITLAQVKFTGYGTFNFAVATKDANGNDITTNVAHATKVADNIVDTFVPGGNVANGEGNLDITTSTTGNVTIAVPVRDLTVVVDFPNEVVNKEIAYQAMNVTVTGGDLKSAIEIDLGSNAAPTDLDIFGKVDAKYAVTFANGAYTVALTDTLTVNNTYTVTVTGEGYRTARYTVTMTGNKTINFWNNVMDEEHFIEESVDGSKTTKNFLAGDIVKDNNINIYDLSAVVSYFAKVNNGADYAEYVKYDLNRDGVIDSKDVAYVLVSWNE